MTTITIDAPADQLHAATAAATIDAFKVGDLRPMPSTAGDWRQCVGQHRIQDIVGYVVRLTVSNRETISRDGERIGYDLAAFNGGHLYAAALDICRPLQGRGTWAVVDRVYACGHRS